MAKLSMKGTIYEKGYGILAKRVMRDKRLSIEARAIYAYIITYSGAGTTAFPSVSLMCDDLKITPHRFYRHFTPLVECGYLKVRHTKKSGRFGRNEYEVVVSPYVDFAHTGKPHTGNDHANSTSLKSTSIKSNRENNGAPDRRTSLFLDSWDGEERDVIEDCISYYRAVYKRRKGREHPRLKQSQLTRIYDTLEAMISENALDEDGLHEMVDRHWKRGMKTDGNINHFATEGVLQNLLYEVAM